jgi:UDP-N-acetylmuramoylalanine--D-glutamate ligase
MKKESFAGKRVLVMGLGRFGGGADAAQFAHRAGAKVIVTDLASAEQLSDSIRQLQTLAGIEFHLGSHDPADFEQADIVIVNPAVPKDNEFLKIAHRGGKCVTSQMNIFFERCPARIIGITGANGKSTTTALTVHLLKSAGYGNVWLSGNIGNQPLLMTIDQIGSDDLVVLELSSFQLEQLARVRKAPKVALLTNLTPNHLDRHGTFADYCAAKENIFTFQQLGEDFPAVSIFNVEDEIGAQWLRKYRKDRGRICIGFSADDVSEEIRGAFALPGRANLSNLAGAIAVARHLGIDDGQIKSCLPEFKALPHRLEFVERIDGVSWYNDSKATTPRGAITALEAFDQPIVIIAGGYDKHIPFDELGRKIVEKAKAVVLIGTTAPKIAKAIEDAAGTENSPKRAVVKTADSLANAVGLAHDLADPGDVVLLSPACASYDMFENYEQRGREFARLVQHL